MQEGVSGWGGGFSGGLGCFGGLSPDGGGLVYYGVGEAGGTLGAGGGFQAFQGYLGGGGAVGDGREGNPDGIDGQARIGGEVKNLIAMVQLVCGEGQGVGQGHGCGGLAAGGA